MSKRILFTLIAGLLLFSSAAAVPRRPVPEGPVNDFSGILLPEQKLSLQHLLVDFADSTSNQICVVITDDLEGLSADEYAIRTGLEWKVGSSEFNNGIVFLVKPKPLDGSGSGDAFIAVGRGLEGAVPDAVCYRILSAVAVPHFRRNDYYSGIEAVCLELMRLCADEYDVKSKEDDAGDIVVALFVLFVIILVVIVLLSRSSGGKGGRTDGFGGGRISRGIVFGNTYPGTFSSGGFGGGFGGGFSGGFGGGSFGGGGGGTRW